MNDILTMTEKKPKEIFDVRMLEVLEVLKQKGTIRFDADFARVMDMDRQTIRNIRIGHQSFSARDILKVCKEFSINVNFIYGFSAKMFRGR